RVLSWLARADERVAPVPYPGEHGARRRGYASLEPVPRTRSRRDHAPYPLEAASGRQARPGRGADVRNLGRGSRDRLPGMRRRIARRGGDLGDDRLVSLLVYADETLDALLQPSGGDTRGASAGHRLGRRRRAA